MAGLSILHTESSMGWGGQEIRVLTEALELAKRGHNVIIACQPRSSLSGRGNGAGIKTVEIPMHGAQKFSACLNLYQLIKREKIQVVNTHSSTDSWLGSFAAKTAGVRLVRTRHIDLPISKNPFNIIYWLPDRIITTSESIKGRLASSGIRQEKIVAIPTGVDCGKFQPARTDERLKMQLGIGRRKPVIATVAVLRSWKGHAVLLKAVLDVIKVFPEAVFLIVGDGPQKETLNKLIQELQIEQWVIMTGHRDDIPEILHAADLFVLPSTRYEGVPQALLQALASGIPVVATRVDGIRDVIEDGETGILADPGDHHSLAEKILAALKNSDAMNKMSEGGRRIVEERYSLHAMTERLEECYFGLVRE